MGLSRVFYLISFITMFISCESDNSLLQLNSKNTDALINKNIESIDNLKRENFNSRLVEVERTELLPSDYLDWVKSRESGLIKSKIIEEIKYQLMYLPNDYLLLKNASNNKILQSEVHDNQVNGDCLIHFLFRISKISGILDITSEGIIGQDSYDERIKYLSFEMQKNLSLESKEGVKTPCVIYTYERDYSITPYSTFTLAFMLCDNQNLSDYRVVFNDKLFNHGMIKFNWNKNIIESIPKLISNE